MNLSSREYGILRAVAASKNATFDSVVGQFPRSDEATMLLRHLHSIGYVKMQNVNPFCDWPVEVTDVGWSALLTYDQYLQDEKKRRKIEAIRYCITTLIALAALAMSVIALRS